MVVTEARFSSASNRLLAALGDRVRQRLGQLSELGLGLPTSSDVRRIGLHRERVRPHLVALELDIGWPMQLVAAAAPEVGVVPGTKAVRALLRAAPPLGLQ